MHLFRRDSPSQHRGPHIAIARLLLSVNSDVVAINVSRRILSCCGVQTESDALLEFLLEIVSCPPVFEEQELEPGTLAVLAQLAGLAGQFSDALDAGLDLIPANERVQTGCEMRFGREPASNPQREAGLRLSAQRAC